MISSATSALPLSEPASASTPKVQNNESQEQSRFQTALNGVQKEVNSSEQASKTEAKSNQESKNSEQSASELSSVPEMISPSDVNGGVANILTASIFTSDGSTVDNSSLDSTQFEGRAHLGVTTSITTSISSDEVAGQEWLEGGLSLDDMDGAGLELNLESSGLDNLSLIGDANLNDTLSKGIGSSAATGQLASTFRSASPEVNSTSLEVSTPLDIETVLLEDSLMMQESGWDKKLSGRVQWMLGQNLQAAEIQLDPPELGPLQIRVSVNQDVAQVVFASQNSQVRDILEQFGDRLREQLESEGLSLDLNTRSDEDSTQRQPTEEAYLLDQPEENRGVGYQKGNSGINEQVLSESGIGAAKSLSAGWKTTESGDLVPSLDVFA